MDRLDRNHVALTGGFPAYTEEAREHGRQHAQKSGRGRSFAVGRGRWVVVGFGHGGFANEDW
jgi:hypothetical protein